jgi:hypothetical protein
METAAIGLYEDLEQSFLDSIGKKIGPCICDNDSCKNIMYSFIGPDSQLEYILEYDPTSEVNEDVNIAIYIKENKYVVFHGRCKNNHDLAQAIRMVAI